VRRLAAGALGALLTLTACATAPPPVEVPPRPTPVPAVPTVGDPGAITAAPDPGLQADRPHRSAAGPDHPSTTEAVELAQPAAPTRARWADRESWLWGPLRLSVTEGGRWWQVGAFRSAEAAETATRRLDEALGADTASNVTEAPDGLLRVRVRWREAEPADPAVVLAGIGFAGAFAVPASGAAHRGGDEHHQRHHRRVVLEAVDAGRSWSTGGATGRLRVRAAATSCWSSTSSTSRATSRRGAGRDGAGAVSAARCAQGAVGGGAHLRDRSPR
jgi:hypothetical protein